MKELPVLFAQTAAFYRVSVDRSFAHLNLNGGQVAVLMSLWRRDGQTQAELARDLGVSAPTVNKMIATMKERGFIRSERCADDSRAVRNYLTEQAIDVRESVEKCWDEVELAHFASFTETEKLIFAQLLGKFGRTS